jgi:hypothetical protein
MMAVSLERRSAMLRSTRLQTAAVLAAGALLGYLAAAGRLNPFPRADAAPAAPEAAARNQAEPGGGAGPYGCSEGVNKGQLLARADPKAVAAAARAQPSAKKPNILIIWGDDIGWFNPSCYHGGAMGYQTPRVARP